MVEREEAGPLDALVKSPAYHVAEFVASTGLVRHVLAEHDGVLVLPERGALPIFWSAEGSGQHEPALEIPTAVLPIGSFHTSEQDPTEHPRGTLTTQQKRNIADFLVPRDPGSIAVLDEVQGGGTSSELVGIMSTIRPQRDPAKQLLIAAQDNRKNIAARNKSEAYTRIATGRSKRAQAIVVPMPLIATDRPVLLNRLYRQAPEKVPKTDTPEVSIEENKEAIALLRYLGSAARTLDILHSPDGLDIVFDRPVTAKTAKRLDGWVERFVHELRVRNPHTRKMF